MPEKLRLPPGPQGFVLVFTILLMLGVTAIVIGTVFNNKMSETTGFNYDHKIKTFMATDGLTTLLAQELINGNGGKYVDTTRMGKIFGTTYTSGTGMNDSNVSSLINILGGGTHHTDSTTYLGFNLNSSHAGSEWTGYLMPPLSGSYTFHLLSHNASAFYLSTDTNPPVFSGSGAVAPICSLSVAQSATVTGWPVSDTGFSKPIYLTAGKRYAFILFHKVGVYLSNGVVQVGWSVPQSLGEFPIPYSRLTKYASDSTQYITYNVGSGANAIPVKYQVASLGLDQFGISTEGDLKNSSGTDTICRVPLTQTISFLGTAEAQPNTRWFRVIYYDYPSDGSNPEFNSNAYAKSAIKSEYIVDPYLDCWLGVHTGQVVNNQLRFEYTHASWFGLDSIGKPIRNTATKAFADCRLNHWFSDDWTSAQDATTPAYDTISSTTNTIPGGSSFNTNSYTGYDTANTGAPYWTLSGPPYYIYKWDLRSQHGTGTDCKEITNFPVGNTRHRTFRKIVFFDSIAFTRIPSLGPNYYQFDTANFFPLDNKINSGDSSWPVSVPSVPTNNAVLGDDRPDTEIYDYIVHESIPSHDYSFCMEMHTLFQYQSGMSLSFAGDDDVWAFVNDSLVIDLGSIHGTSSQTVLFDNLPNLTYGNTYPFDLFYCERQDAGSDIKMDLNFPMLYTTSTPVTSWKRNYGSMN